MSFTHWLRKLQSICSFGTTSRVSRRAARSRPAKRFRLQLECLEDRCLPSTYTVTNLLDSGTDSLRAAITAANANPGADTIDFATTGTIALTSGQLDVTDSLTINGPGAGALTVSGERLSRVFAIAGNPTVSIADLTVANGWWSQGGGVYMAGGNLTLARVNVSGNAAVGGWGGLGAGGGLYVAGGTLTLDHSTLSNNAAVGGEGFNWFQAVPGGAAAGGGLYVASGTVYINQSTFSGNRAVGGTGNPSDAWNGISAGDGGEVEGGGLYVGGGAVFIDNSTFSGNWAAGGNGGEGEEYFYAPSGSGGRAAGGGISVWGGRGGVVYLNQSTVSGNSATGGLGGALGSSVEGDSGFGVGGGLNISPGVPPLADLDTFTEAHTVNNLADIDPNISGPYSLNGTFVRTLAISDVSTLEGNTGTQAVTFTVTLSAASTETITVAYATGDGTATAGSDYAAASGTLTFAPGENSKTFAVDVIGDRLGEANETFLVNLTSATNATIADGWGVGNILDDEPRISIGDVTVTEGNTGTANATFTLTLSEPSGVDVTVHYDTTNGTAVAGGDFVAASGDVTIPAGQISATFTVAVLGDRLPEPTETFRVNLSAPTNAAIADGAGVCTILDDEPRVSINDLSKNEGKNNQSTVFTFTITLSVAYDVPVTLSFATTDGTAKTSDNDYVANSGTITFAPGETSKTITVVVKGDKKKEANENFFVDLSDLSGYAVFLDSRGTGTIQNDD